MWKNIYINENNIEHYNGRSVLIKMPKSSDYKDYVFWHPVKCVHENDNKRYITLGYTDEWTFSLKKYGKGKFNKYQVIEEIEITVEEFENAFRDINDNYTKKALNRYETHKPEKLEPIECDVLEDLKDE